MTPKATAVPLAALALALAFVALPALAQDGGGDAPALPSPKIWVGVIDTGKAIDASRQGKSAASRIQKRYKELDARLSDLQKAAQGKAEELSRAAERLSPAEFESRRAALQREVESVQAETAKAESELKSAAEETYGPLYDRAAALASDYAREKGLLLVLENSDEDKAVIYADAGVSFIDITESVTGLLDSGGASAPKGRSGGSGESK
ncbi:MAG: OmpH family outer membrane protein [Deltaproteobacteria bacterium]|jgi:Skp family chaperone for outer membrane proteins|nr:OmpH family outer membrane protein [Deltaproteobacteria bacterium]